MSSDLISEIEKKRIEMIQIGLAKGFTNEETVKLSQEVDDLINQSFKIDQKLD